MLNVLGQINLQYNTIQTIDAPREEDVPSKYFVKSFFNENAIRDTNLKNSSWTSYPDISKNLRDPTTWGFYYCASKIECLVV
jgi:hypothetical protein